MSNGWLLSRSRSFLTIGRRLNEWVDGWRTRPDEWKEEEEEEEEERRSSQRWRARSETVATPTPATG